jgi:RNA polymerase primary sigma factor
MGPEGTDITGSYLKEIRKVEVLSPEEERRLARRSKKGDKEARDELVRRNLKLVVSIAKQYQGHGLPLPDLIQEGNLGLMRAIERFEPERGYKLSTYATCWIRQTIIRALLKTGRTIRLPEHASRLSNKIKKIEQRWVEENGIEPTEQELAEQLEVSVERLREIRQVGLACSLDRPICDDEDEGVRLVELLDGGNFYLPEEAVQSMLLKQELEQALTALTPREKEIITLRYGLIGKESLTLRQVAKKLGFSREYIRRIQKEAEQKLRSNPRFRKAFKQLFHK